MIAGMDNLLKQPVKDFSADVTLLVSLSFSSETECV
jgi:hypothetical protein